MQKMDETPFRLITCSIIAVFFMVGIAPMPSARGDTREEEAPFTSSGVCATCHKEIYDYWSKSMHRHSVDDPVFYVAYLEAYKNTEGAARLLCTRCHAPTTLLTEDYSMENELSKEGVTCDFCHSVRAMDSISVAAPFRLEVGKIKFGPPRADREGSEGHEVEDSRLHTTSRFCAGCHEYRNEKGVLILGTYSEWEQSAYSKEDKQCQFCHMAEVSGNITTSREGEKTGRGFIKRHDVSGGHSVAMLKRAVEVRIVDVEKEGERVRVTVDLTNKGSGHMVPTGMPSRMLVLQASVKTDKGMLLTSRRVYKKTLLDEEGNEITRDSDIFIKSAYIGSDNRLGPGETRRENFLFFTGRGRAVKASASASYLYKPLVLEEGRMEVEMSSDSTPVK